MFARSVSVIKQYRHTTVRKMAGHHAPVPAEGFEGMVRKVLPHDYQLSMAVIGFYFTLYLGSKLFSSKKKDVPALTTSVSTQHTGEIPSIESPEFGTWISTPGNIEKMLA